MANYRTYSTANYQQAAETAALYLQNFGIFDAVTLSENVISCAYGGETVATITYSSTSIDVTFGAYTFHAGDVTAFWLGMTENGVLLDHVNTWVDSGNYLYSIAIMKSLGGTPMLQFREGRSNASRNILACDSPDAPAAEAVAISTNAYYSNLVGIATNNTESETVAAADKAFRYAERQTNVPTNQICVVSIGGTNYLTDGFMCLLDE